MFNKMLGTAALMVLTAGVASAQEGDAEAGEKVFRKCMACHAVGEGAENKVGPQLNNLIGRTAGSLEDFNYSDAMVAKGEEGLVWDAETIAAFMEKPRDYVEGTKMSFAGLRSDEDITAITAFLEAQAE